MAKVSPFITMLYQFLELGEKLFLGASMVAFGLMRFDFKANEILILALGGLSAVYFLLANKPPLETEDKPTDENPNLGFFDLLITSIAPKVGWIGCSVVVIGILFWYQKWEGFKEMLLLGGGTLFIVSLLLTYAFINGNKAVTHLLMRATLFFLICFILLSKSGFFG
jgi:hypothetical protein